MKLGYILEKSMCCLYSSIYLKITEHTAIIVKVADNSTPK